MNLLKNFTAGFVAVGLVGGMATAAHAFECKIKDASMAKPGGFPDRPLTMIVLTAQVVAPVRSQPAWLKP